MEETYPWAGKITGGRSGGITLDVQFMDVDGHIDTDFTKDDRVCMVKRHRGLFNIWPSRLHALDAL